MSEDLPKPFTAEWLDRIDELVAPMGIRVKRFGAVSDGLDIVCTVGLVSELIDPSRKVKPCPVMLSIERRKGVAA